VVTGIANMIGKPQDLPIVEGF